MSFNKYPTVKIESKQDYCVLGWDSICDEINSSLEKINKDQKVVVLECYQGVHFDEIIKNIKNKSKRARILDSRTLMKSESQIREMTFPDVTESRVFGVITNLQMEDFFDTEKIRFEKDLIEHSEGTTIIIGVGASLLCQTPDLLIYADMARWEIQQRMRKNKVNNIGINDKGESIEKQYKRAYFVDWRVCDELKKKLISKWDYVLDTNDSITPKMARGESIRDLLSKVTERPFSVVPFFDPGPWGGQWMKNKFNLDPSQKNFAWCFNCVPEENSLLIEFSNTTFEIPSINVVFFKPLELLGPSVYNQFGAEFPIRFDFLDTIGGGNLSLQVHPLKEYIKKHFNMSYTQDESYYILDATDDAIVYLGTKNKVDSEEMIEKLKLAELSSNVFKADDYAQTWPAKKHDHFLIPAGTIHCSGSGCMVLEISATPYIFTFKLWDWGRVGSDGQPRPISIEHGEKVIKWDRNSNWTKNNLINQFEIVESGKGWVEEKTGLHELEFIETRRQWFDCKVFHDTKNNLNVLMLIEGDQALVESPDNSFEPFLVNYAEAFIVPASVGRYTIRPYKVTTIKKLAIIKAFVKN